MSFLVFLTIISTSLGRIQGVQRAHGDAYLGIPYAQPPVDSLLFRAPVPIAAWDTVLDATYGKSNCVQEKSRFSATHLSRNCLYLNIYVPNHRPTEKMPVMVWLHGGSYATGGTGAQTDSTLRHDMGVFADRMHAIVVTVNYRLNVFGYLYLHGLSPHFDSNCGLRDQIMALEWVNKHIGAFGGDKKRVTLIGQSAGAGSVMAIMSIPRTYPLYQRVILMSPPIGSYLTTEEATQRARTYLKLLDIKPEQVEKMHYCQDEDIMAVNHQFLIRMVLCGNLDCAFAPVIDGELLTQRPDTGALQCRKPMMIGYVANEAELFGQNIPKFLLPWLARLVHVEVTKKEEPNQPYFDRLFGEISRQMFFAPIDSFYHAYKGPKHHYLYDYITPEMQAQKLRCCHSFEMPVIFGWQSPICDPTNPRTQQVGDSICKQWKQFIL